MIYSNVDHIARAGARRAAMRGNNRMGALRAAISSQYRIKSRSIIAAIRRALTLRGGFRRRGDIVPMLLAAALK